MWRWPGIAGVVMIWGFRRVENRRKSGKYPIGCHLRRFWGAHLQDLLKSTALYVRIMRYIN